MIKRALIICSILTLGLVWNGSAQNAKAILGEWYTTEKDAIIEIFEKEGKFFGKVVWMEETHIDGKPILDTNNSDKSKRSRPILGMNLLQDFEFNNGVWENGTIYDPRNGKSYSCTIKKKSDDVLEVRGFVGLSLIGRTVEWTKAE